MTRAVLSFVLFALAIGTALAEPIDITAQSIRNFSRAEPGRTEFGPLTFRGGFVLTSPSPRFGGFSALRVEPGGRFVALSDRAYWLMGKLVQENGLSAIRDTEIFPVLGRSGRKLAGTRLGDTEGLEIDGATAWVGIERAHQVLKFDLSKGIGRARAAPVAGAKSFRELPHNEGLEALGIVPAGPEKGTLLAVSEAGFDAAGNHKAWLLAGRTGKPPRALSVKHRDGFAITDLDFLPGGDLVLLERRYRPPLGLHMRLRRIPVEAIAEDAVLDGEVLIEASLVDEIDNMEGLSIHRGEDGAAVLTLISDDNFSAWQRTVLLQFGIVEK